MRIHAVEGLVAFTLTVFQAVIFTSISSHLGVWGSLDLTSLREGDPAVVVALGFCPSSTYHSPLYCPLLLRPLHVGARFLVGWIFPGTWWGWCYGGQLWSDGEGCNGLFWFLVNVNVKKFWGTSWTLVGSECHFKKLFYFLNSSPLEAFVEFENESTPRLSLF